MARVIRRVVSALVSACILALWLLSLRTIALIWRDGHRGVASAAALVLVASSWAFLRRRG